jgi:energy-coupling factor transport system ATP-binding protein
MLMQISHLSFRYPDMNNRLINDFSLNICKGDIIALTGNSGAGKTTLLFLLSGIIPRHRNGTISGNITLTAIDHKNCSLAELSPHISLTMQHPDEQLFFPIVEQELAFAPENLCLPAHQIENRILKALNILNIKHLRYKNTADLSYGQQKLVALAAIHTLQPQILLLDEISNGLDAPKRENVIRFIKEYALAGNAVVIADHDPVILETAEICRHLPDHE